MNKATVHKRAKQALALFTLVDGLWNSLEKVPSFTGKARLVDKVRRVRTHAHNLRWDLDRDASAK